MTQLVLFVVASFGAIYGVTAASITAPFRIALARRHPLLEALLYCPMCVGFWVGLVVGWYSFGHFDLAYGFAITGLASLVERWLPHAHSYEMVQPKPLEPLDEDPPETP